MTPSTVRPSPASARLERWSSVWRYTVAVVTGLLFWGMDVVLVAEVPGAQDWHAFVAVLGLPVGLAFIVLLRWRRRYPLAVALVLGVVSGFAPSASGASLIAMVSLGTRRRWQDVPPVLVTGLVASLVYDRSPLAVEQTPIILLVVFVTLFTVGVMATGWYIGARRDLLTSLRERAETAEREQSLRADQARANERAAIAREMHDVLAHRISLIAMHAGALTYRRDLTPEQSTQAAQVIETAAQEALTDLRDVLGVLRATPGTDVAYRPQPTLADLDTLFAEVRAAGTRLEVTTDLPADQLQQPPGAIGRHAYRIVQEALTNARKHATLAPVSIRLEGRPGGELLVLVSNPIVGSQLALPSAGSGLTGLAERAALAGGRLESGRRGRLFIVQAWLPWPSASQSAEAIEPAEAVEPVELIEAVEAVEPAGTSGPPGPATEHPARPEPMETR